MRCTAVPQPAARVTAHTAPVPRPPRSVRRRPMALAVALALMTAGCLATAGCDVGVAFGRGGQGYPATSTAPAVTVTATGVPVAGWATDEAGTAAGPAAASPSATTHLLDDKVGAPAGVAKKRTGGQWLQLPDGTGLTLQSQSKNAGDYPWQRFADPSRAITALVQAVPLADTNEAMQQQITDTARDFRPGTFYFQADTTVSGRYAEPVSVYSFVSGGHAPGTWGSEASSAALEHWGVYVEALKCGFIVDFAMGEGQGEKDLADVESWLEHLRLVKP